MSAQNRYSNGKIYKLVNSVDDKVYIGSTCCTLSKRLYCHKQAALRILLPAYKHLNEIGWRFVRIVLIEDVTAFNKDQLLMREQHYIDTLKPELNKNAAYVPRYDLDCKHCRARNTCIQCKEITICEHQRYWDQCSMCEPLICTHIKNKKPCNVCKGDKNRCECCAINFASGNDLHTHQATKLHRLTLSGDQYKCIACNLNFESNTGLQIHKDSLLHKKTAVGDKFKCITCDYVAGSNAALIRHNKSTRHHKRVAALSV